MISSSQAFADRGLITKPSKYTVQQTIEKFEAAVKSKAPGGWVIFSRIDHAAAAKDAGMEMRPRTVIIFGNPRGGTPSMTKSARTRNRERSWRPGIAPLEFNNDRSEK